MEIKINSEKNGLTVNQTIIVDNYNVTVYDVLECLELISRKIKDKLTEHLLKHDDFVNVKTKKEFQSKLNLICKQIKLNEFYSM